MAITRDQIFAVADEIDAAGQNATLAAVRKALGGGSFTTISDGMTEWKFRLQPRYSQQTKKQKCVCTTAP